MSECKLCKTKSKTPFCCKEHKNIYDEIKDKVSVGVDNNESMSYKVKVSIVKRVINELKKGMLRKPSVDDLSTLKSLYQTNTIVTRDTLLPYMNFGKIYWFEEYNYIAKPKDMGKCLVCGDYNIHPYRRFCSVAHEKIWKKILYTIKHNREVINMHLVHDEDKADMKLAIVNANKMFNKNLRGTLA